jgi:hypothetical protein
MMHSNSEIGGTHAKYQEIAQEVNVSILKSKTNFSNSDTDNMHGRERNKTSFTTVEKNGCLTSENGASMGRDHLTAPILNESECLTIGTATEADFEDLVLQKLTAILSPRAVVLSRNSSWLSPLDSPGNDGAIFEGELTPDAFVIHPSFVRRTSSPAATLSCAPAHESLFKGMGLLAFNHVGKPAPEGLVRQHGQLSAVFWRANLYHTIMPYVPGAVIMRSAITLIKYHPNYDTYFANVAWGEEGGAARLREHFAEWAVARLLQALLDAMDLRLCEDSVECLGGGRLGSVFRVCGR